MVGAETPQSKGTEEVVTQTCPPPRQAQALGWYSQGRGLRHLTGGRRRNSGKTGLLGLCKETKMGEDILLDEAGLGPLPLTPLT